MDKIEKNILPDEKLTAFYKANSQGILNASTNVLNRYRADAFNNFIKLGLPKYRSEDYKYLDVPALFRKEYQNCITPQRIEFKIDDIFRCDVPALDTHYAILLNGFFHDHGTTLHELPNGVIMGSLLEASRRYPDLVARYYNRYATLKEEGLVSLNTLFALDGIFVYIPRNSSPDKPIQIINIQMHEMPLLVQYRNLIILEENSTAEIIVCDHTLSPQPFLSNAVTEIYAGTGSRLNYTKMQNQHNASALINHRFVYQEKESYVNSTAITLHGGIVRNNLFVRMAGEGSSNVSSGLFMTDQGQHVDNFTWVEHAAPHCESRQFFKGILDDFSSGAFSGRIVVQPGAQKTNAYQKNNNLLLTSDARMNTRPQLEIYADDVKCSHGATVGQLDKDAMFYLRSRGIGYEEARFLLMFAFANEVLANIPVVPLRARIADLVNKRLRRELSPCNSCPMHCC